MAETAPDKSEPQPRYGRGAPRALLGLRLELRDPNAVASWYHRLIVIAVGLSVCVIYLLFQPEIGSDLFSLIWNATLGSSLGISQLLDLATPLILAGVAAALAQRMALWNIGIEGQLFMGAWAATGVAYAISAAPGPVLILVMMLSAAIAGALWIAVPGLLRAWLGVSEVFTTLMLNFVAFLWFVYMISTHWGDKSFQGGGLSSRPITDAALFPSFTVGSVTVSIGLIVVLGIALGIWAAVRWSVYGFASSLSGVSVRTAFYSGVAVKRIVFVTLLISGAVGGLVGVIVELDGVQRYSTALSNNTGYIGIVVAVLAGNAIAGCIGTGVLLAFVVASGSALQIAGLSGEIVLLLTGVLLLAGALANVVARYSIVRTAKDSLTDPGPIASA